MGQISLRPEFITAGGEACGILVGDQYVGSLTLLYREQDRIWGTIQLDEDVLDVQEKEDIDYFIHDYIENLIDALDAPDCIVTSTYSSYDHIISTDLVEDMEEEEYDEYELEAVEYDLDDDGDNDNDLEIEPYQLVIVGESRNKLEYQLFDDDNDLVAEAMIKLKGNQVKGKIFWNFNPSDDELDCAAATIVEDFDEDEIESFRLKMYYNDEELVVFDLKDEG